MHPTMRPTIYPPIRQKIADAVQLVNDHAGRATVHLLFKGESEIDFIANAARLEGEAFSFEAGFESFSGSLDEVGDIRTEVIH